MPQTIACALSGCNATPSRYTPTPGVRGMPAFVVTAQSLVDLRQITPDQIVLLVESRCALEVFHGRLVISDLLAGQAKGKPRAARVRIKAKRFRVLDGGF